MIFEVHTRGMSTEYIYLDYLTLRYLPPADTGLLNSPMSACRGAKEFRDDGIGITEQDAIFLNGPSGASRS